MFHRTWYAFSSSERKKKTNKISTSSRTETKPHPFQITLNPTKLANCKPINFTLENWQLTNSDNDPHMERVYERTNEMKKKKRYRFLPLNSFLFISMLSFLSTEHAFNILLDGVYVCFEIWAPFIKGMQ